jgi:hypothetical protein
MTTSRIGLWIPSVSIVVNSFFHLGDKIFQCFGLVTIVVHLSLQNSFENSAKILIFFWHIFNLRFLQIRKAVSNTIWSLYSGYRLTWSGLFCPSFDIYLLQVLMIVEWLFPYFVAKLRYGFALRPYVSAFSLARTRLSFKLGFLPETGLWFTDLPEGLFLCVWYFCIICVNIVSFISAIR